MISFIIKLIYLMLPGIVANMMPIIMKGSFKWLGKPVDFNKEWRGKPLFGPHKTIRGFIFGVLGSILIVALQRVLYDLQYFKSISVIPYAELNWILVGFLIGFGVLFGDVIESFFKRRFDVKPGKPFIPWDQIDSLVGGLAFLSLYWIPPIGMMIFALIAAPILHILLRHIAFYLKITKSKW